MEGRRVGEEIWDEENDEESEDDDEAENSKEVKGGREGKWESGKGRCAVTGRRLLGGTNGLRRVMV